MLFLFFREINQKYQQKRIGTLQGKENSRRNVEKILILKTGDMKANTAEKNSNEGGLTYLQDIKNLTVSNLKQTQNR
jgi:hypothetical protein